MSIRAIITDGFGSFGTVPDVIRMGYSGEAVEPEPEPEAQAPSGGFEIGRRGTLRTREDIRRDRERFGVIPKAAHVIAQVAAAQADALSLDEQQRLEHLEREIEAQGLVYENRYLELLNVMRERLIAEETGKRLRLLQQIEEETVVTLMLMATA
jgi:hypothetical protein